MDAVGIFQRHKGRGHDARALGHSDIDHAQPAGVGDGQIAKLQCRRACASHGHHRRQLGSERVFQIDDDHALGGGDVGVRPTHRDVPRALEHAAHVPGQRPLDEVVARVTVLQRVHVDQDQAFFSVGDQRVVVDRVHRLLLVRHAHQVTVVLGRRHRLRGGQHHARRVAAGDVGALAQCRKRRGDDALRHALVGDRGHVVHAHAALAFGHIEVFTAQLQAAGTTLGAVIVGFGQRSAACFMRGVPVGVGVAVQVAADDRLRLIPLGDLHRLDVPLLADPGVVANEADVAGAVHQRLRHDGVVVLVGRQVAVAAGFGFGLALGVWVVRGKGLAGKAAGRRGRLLDVDLFAVGIGRRQHQRRRRTHRCDLAALDRAVAAQMEHVIACDLRVVGGEVAARAAFVVVRVGLFVGLDRQVAA